MTHSPGTWSNESAIGAWDARTTRASLEATADEGDFAKRHLVNPELLRMLGDVRGARILDAGCGNGYLARMLAERGARVTGVEPAAALREFAREREAGLGQGIEYLDADLAAFRAEAPFDAVVSSMVLMAVPDWRPALRSCVDALRPGGLLVIGIVHPAFEQLYGSWREHGAYRATRYLEEYEIPGDGASDFHRPLSAYLNELAAAGCRLRELAEPGIDPALAADDPALTAYVRFPNFALIAAEKG